jgi:hypothetical protein
VFPAGTSSDNLTCYFRLPIKPSEFQFIRINFLQPKTTTSFPQAMHFVSIKQELGIPLPLIQATALRLSKTFMLLLSEGKTGKVCKTSYAVMPFTPPFPPQNIVSLVSSFTFHFVYSSIILMSLCSPLCCMKNLQGRYTSRMWLRIRTIIRLNIPTLN